MFQPVESSVSFPKLEEEVIRFWQQRQIYEKSVDARSGAPAFVFYEARPRPTGFLTRATA